MSLPAPSLQAKKRYEADKKAEEAHRRATLGSWEWNQEAGYYYNALHRWYYDKSTGDAGGLAEGGRTEGTMNVRQAVACPAA